MRIASVATKAALCVMLCTPPAGADTLFQREPLVLDVAAIDPAYNLAFITDIHAADFDRDGRTDLALAWFATDFELDLANARRLVIYFGDGLAGFSEPLTLDLFLPDAANEALSVFRNGSASVAVGDFDGDGDPDLAVTPFFGDELWLIENLGQRQFRSYLKFVFGVNGAGNFLTPPGALAADFDGDGRDELVYIADPIQRILGLTLHFWRTETSIANMTRTDWEGDTLEPIQWTRGLTVADFDSDQRADLCFIGTADPTLELLPRAVWWHGLDTSLWRFQVHSESLGFVGADVASVAEAGRCGPGVLVTDRDGVAVEAWQPTCEGSLDFAREQTIEGYAGLSTDRGMAAAVADLDGDGDMDLVTRQKLGGPADPNRVEITLRKPGDGGWSRVVPNPLDTRGFGDPVSNPILRPRDLALADVFGNRLPEIVAAFGPTPSEDGSVGYLQVAIWPNSCLGDIDADGQSGLSDVALLLAQFGSCQNDPGFDANADLSRNGCTDLSDLAALLADFGCQCCGE